MSFTENLDEDEKLLFLQKFPPLRNIAPHLYVRRREYIPADPKTQEEFDVYLEMFNYEEGKGVCIGDIQLSDGTLTELRPLWNNCIKTKDHSLTQLREQYEEEKYKTEEVRKICERVEKKEKQEVRE